MNLHTWDPATDEVDVVFREAAWSAHLTWDSPDAGEPGTLEAAAAMLATWSGLWLPDRWALVTAPLLEGGYRAVDGRSERAAAHAPTAAEAGGLDAAAARDLVGNARAGSEAGRALAEVHASVHGWDRLALPPGVEPSGAWAAVCPDGLAPRPLTVRPAPSTGGVTTAWARLDGLASGSKLALTVVESGLIEARVALGVGYFAPTSDPRGGDHIVRGVPLAAWRRAHAALLRAVLDELAAAGVTIDASP